MATYSDRVVKSVTHYQPYPLPIDQEDLGLYLTTELKRLGDVIFNQAIFRLERTHHVPSKPREGDVRYFDGANADPLGTGDEGIYYFKKGTPGAWIFLG